MLIKFVLQLPIIFLTVVFLSLDLLTVPSAGAMNFVKHMKESEKIQQSELC